MSPVTAAALAAAVQRLRGHVIATPLIGTPWLPGAGSVPDVRWKPELLQPGGSGWYRGYQHFLLRRMGGCAGLVYCGVVDRVLAAAIAAQQHRLPLVAMLPVAPAPTVAALLQSAGVEVHAGGDAGSARDLCRSRGFTLLPDASQPDVALGMATIGAELAEELPQGCDLVLAPGAVAAVIAAGLAASGRGIPVATAATTAPTTAGLSDLGEAILRGHRLSIGAEGLELLAAAMERHAREPVGVVVLE